MVTKKPGENLKLILTIKHQGMGLPYRLECAFGACGLGGCSMPGSGFTIEPGLHWSLPFETVRHTTPTEILEQMNMLIPLDAKAKAYDAKVWIADGNAPYTIQWETRVGDAVEIVSALPPPPPTTAFGNHTTRFS